MGQQGLKETKMKKVLIIEWIWSFCFRWQIYIAGRKYMKIYNCQRSPSIKYCKIEIIIVKKKQRK